MNFVPENPYLALRTAKATARAIRAYWVSQGAISGGQHVVSQKGEGIEWADVRPYQYGDEVKWISWKHSCRSPHVTWVKTFEVERAHRVVIVLDRSHSMMSGILQNRYAKAWWIAAVLAYLVMRQKDICMVFHPHAKASRLRFETLKDDARVARWALSIFDLNSENTTSETLHAHIAALRKELTRHASVVVLTDGYGDYDALHRELKLINAVHEVRVILFPDVCHAAGGISEKLNAFGWRWPAWDGEQRLPFVTHPALGRSEWRHFWNHLALPQVEVGVCEPHADLPVFTRRLFQR